MQGGCYSWVAMQPVRISGVQEDSRRSLPALSGVNLSVRLGELVCVCGEVGPLYPCLTSLPFSLMASSLVLCAAISSSQNAQLTFGIACPLFDVHFGSSAGHDTICLSRLALESRPCLLPCLGIATCA